MEFEDEEEQEDFRDRMRQRAQEAKDCPRPWIIGTNVRCYPAQTMDYVEVKTVLVLGDIGDYAAYSGVGGAKWVAELGNKIPFEEAQVHFCGQLEREAYRD